MFLTELIKYQPYKELILEQFPKPTVQKEKVKKFINTNPSLTGNAFELFFRITYAENVNFSETLVDEFGNAQSNIYKLAELRDKQRISITKENWLNNIYLNSRSFNLIKENFTSNLNKNIFSVEEEKLRFIKIHKIDDFNAVKHIQQILHTYNISIWSSYILHDIDNLISIHENAVESFKKKLEKYLQTKRFTFSFFESLIRFSHISSKYFDLNSICRNIEIPSDYLKSVYLHFKQFKACQQLNEVISYYHPTLHQHGILAIPDLIYSNKIIELKTSQSFFSSNDYLQALSYLLFAQSDKNIKQYGNMITVSIYYSVYNKQVDIHFDETRYTVQFKRKMFKAIKSFRKYKPENQFGK